jgi:ribosomal-protein-alanine N-acetyltransferase
MAKPATISIRDATPQDVIAMLEIERSAGGASHWAATDYERIFLAESPRRFALIAGSNLPQGFLVARAVDKEWEIENLAVAVHVRRHGVGRALVAELLRRALEYGAANVMLEVRASNRPARALYESAGFRAMGTRTSYYHDPAEDAVTYHILPRRSR